MLPNLQEIKDRRKQLNLTQLQLAELSSVSQSLIAKIESKQTIPGYENAKKLFDCLEKTSETHRISAQNIMQSKVIAVKETDSLQKAIRTMEKHGFSQVPVLQKEHVVGMISEKGALQKVEAGWSAQKISETTVQSIMEDALPEIPGDTPFKAVANLLEHSPAVLITQKGKIKGIITKSDLLKSVLDKKITKHTRLI
ncbi:CBS domain-containing protein [Candidatus Micrarchaeota archaeon]|nr:CBS domain-containing protein [Candidatus Micrarchaeota archaeon]MBU1930456.1 CBS domain-containing protein [Candidatus Micrarchaeota archaeon]